MANSTYGKMLLQLANLQIALETSNAKLAELDEKAFQLSLDMKEQLNNYPATTRLVKPAQQLAKLAQVISKSQYQRHIICNKIEKLLVEIDEAQFLQSLNTLAIPPYNTQSLFQVQVNFKLPDRVIGLEKQTKENGFKVAVKPQKQNPDWLTVEMDK